MQLHDVVLGINVEATKVSVYSLVQEIFSAKHGSNESSQQKKKKEKIYW